MIKNRLTLSMLLVLVSAGVLAACGASEPAPVATTTPVSSSGVPHSPGGTIVLPPAATNPDTFAPGATPEVTRFDVPSSVQCDGDAPKTVTAVYETKNADRLAFVLDGRQLPGGPPVSGRFDVTIPCDGRTHVVLITAVSPDNQTAVDSRAVAAKP
jgi:hypothetical protein